MKKIILRGAKCLTNTTLHGDWILDANKIDIHSRENKIIFITSDNTFYLEYKDEFMAQDAMDYLSDAMCEPDAPPAYKMPVYDTDHDFLNTFAP